jgi:hypothetical protein
MKKPKEVATHYGVGHMKVLHWIRQGIVPALDGAGAAERAVRKLSKT